MTLPRIDNAPTSTQRYPMDRPHWSLTEPSSAVIAAFRRAQLARRLQRRFARESLLAMRAAVGNAIAEA